METQVKGALGENIVIGELLKRNLDVYLPIVDRGIDCIVRSRSGRCFEIQIKTRATLKRGKYIFDVKKFNPQDNFFIVCYQHLEETFWVFPSKVFKEYAYERKKYGRYRLHMNPKKQRLLRQYRNNFNQLM